MISVSKAFQDKIYEPNRNKIQARIAFEIFDKTAYADSTVSATSSASISRVAQVTDMTRSMSYKYATFEKDYFKLDGSFRIPPKPDEGDNEVGWWSGILSDGDGFFTPNQVVDIVLDNPHSSTGLTITFEPLAGEYAKEFDIAVYDSIDGLLYYESVVDNNSSTYMLDRGLDNYKKIVLTIKKWVNPYRMARVTEIDFGIIQVYEDNSIVKANLVEQLNVISDTLPSNELKFTIDNSDRKFNILNPVGFYRFLKHQQEVSMSLGLELENGVFEHIPMGRFYLIDWNSDEGALTTTFTARNIFELLDNSECSINYTGSLYEFIELILESAGVADYSIDAALQNVPVSGFPDKLSVRKALQYIGIFGKCAIYQDRYGVLTIKRFALLNDTTSYLVYAGIDSYCGAVIPETNSHLSMRQITFDNIYKEPQIKLDRPLYSLTIVLNNETKDEIMLINNGVSGGIAMRHENPLITTQAQAQDIANWIFSESNLRAIYNTSWRQNPALECGDVIILEDSYKENKQSRILKQEFEYQGYLGGKTESRGGV